MVIHAFGYSLRVSHKTIAISPLQETMHATTDNHPRLWKIVKIIVFIHV